MSDRKVDIKEWRLTIKKRRKRRQEERTGDRRSGEDKDRDRIKGYFGI